MKMRMEERGLGSKLGSQRESKLEGRPERELDHKAGLLRLNNNHRPWQRSQYHRSHLEGSHPEPSHPKIQEHKLGLCQWRMCRVTSLKSDHLHNLE